LILIKLVIASMRDVRGIFSCRSIPSAPRTWQALL
jgi:hypothetical protein